MDISLQLSIPLWIYNWISLDFYGYPCIDLLWILDPGDTGIPIPESQSLVSNCEPDLRDLDL